jgi:hypothetical protein
LTRYNDEVRVVPNIINIDKIDKMLDGKHPDAMAEAKIRYRYGLFLAKPKMDPFNNVMKYTSLMDKAYEKDVPEDISDLEVLVEE